MEQNSNHYLAMAPHFNVHRMGDDQFMLLSEDQSFRLSGAGYVMIIPLLDGRLTRAQILEQLAGRASADEINGLIDIMLAKRYVVPVEPWADSARSAFWSAQNLPPVDCETHLAQYRVAVVALGKDGPAGSVQASQLTAMLMAAGFCISDYKNAHVSIVLVEDYLQPALGEFARSAAQRKALWIPFKPGGMSAWFGPIMGSHNGDHNCYFCLARRLAEHRPGEHVLVPSMTGVRSAKAWTPATLAIANGQATLELTRFALGQSQQIEQRLVTWGIADGQNGQHMVPLFDDCPSASAQQAGDDGQKDRVEAIPIRLSSVKNFDGADGGWRALSPGQALAKLEPIVSPITGIVAHIHPVALGEGLHVYNASQGHRAAIDPRQNRTLGRPGGASGKGLSAKQAKISCLAEAVERYGAQWVGSEPRRQASWRDLGTLAPHPRDLLQYSDFQYENRAELNKTIGMMGRIAEPFDETALIDWSPAWSLRDDAERWLPSRFCFYQYPDDLVPGDHKFCWADSNGCATGGSIEEAILQGFLEVVERDAVAIWWYNRLRMRLVAFDGLDDTYVAQVQDYYRGLGRDVWLLDITTDLGIPVVVAVSATFDGRRILTGFGAHIDGRIAALRALTEIHQAILFDQSPETERSANHQVDDAVWQWLDKASLADHSYLKPDGVITVDEMPTHQFDNIDQAVRYGVDCVAQAGHDFIVVDYSRKDLPLNCVRVVVPGLRHFWNRRAVGRLTEAPVQMGKLDRSLNEDELNPVNFFL
ncbi:TOMM precursor leader peptide-binding protein [Thalassospira alkalitolerans]|uniref:TOMM precursor leader peptide-binding protein n=1 Tax=Thalassospira alkalitolerans TaxID=1293890 RepID=UPI003AA84C61